MANRLLARIRHLRETKGLTQEAFAEKSGIGYKYYQSVEAGRRRDIRLSTLIKLAEGLNLTLSELVDLPAPSPAETKAAPAKTPQATPAKPTKTAPARRSPAKSS